MIALTSLALFVHIFFNDIMRNYAPFYVNADCAVCFSIAFFLCQASSAGNNGRSTFNDRQNPLSDRLKLPTTDQNDR